MSYLFYQSRAGSYTWECALASERGNLVAKGVEMISVLDVSSSFDTDLLPDELAKVTYSAPYGFYCDFDGDLDEVLGQAKLFLLKLEDAQEFDLTQARLWLTGGRGCHIELPLQCFMSKVPGNGVMDLPAIFKEIAMDLYVDTLDMRVYTGKKGRMWRVPNVKRSNGLYKVQVTVDEFMKVTPETYGDLCSAPRPALSLSPATFNAKLGLVFNRAVEKVTINTRRRKSKKVNDEEAQRFNGEWPDSFRLLLTGEHVKPTVGWNQIAVQVASFALAIGKTEEQAVEDARGLIDSHAGDSDRYGTARKRERELRNQYRYQDGNASYSFSIGGIKSLFERGAYTSDIDWAGTVAEEDLPPPPAEGEEPSEDVEPEHDPDAKVTFGANGIYAVTEDGTKKVSSMGFTAPVSLVNKEDRHIGFEIKAWLDNEALGSAFITLANMKSKANFNDWVNQFATWQSLTDYQVGQLLDVLRKRTKKGKNKMIVTNREGLDLIVYPGAKSAEDVDIIFASPSHCLGPKDRQYRFRGQHDEHGSFKTDLLEAPRLEDNEEHRAFFDRLWKINTPGNVGKIVGWFSAAFMCQPIRHRWGAFPMLQVWGEAGAGKSHTVELFSQMHYFLKNPKKISSGGNTFFPMMAAVTQSASIPVIFEEMKPRQMAKYQLDQIQNLMRTNYTGDALERGSINKDSAGGGTKVNGYDNVAPIMFIGEAVEAQTAIFERCVSVPLSKADRAGCSLDFEYCYSRRKGKTMASLGRSMVDTALATNIHLLNDRVDHYRNVFRSRLPLEVYENQNRPWHNFAVVLTGLDFLDLTLSQTFGERYVADIEVMRAAVIDSAVNHTQKAMSEAAKVLDVMGMLTRVTDVQFRLERNVDYITNGNTVEIKLRPAFAKYVRYRLSLKQEVLYDTDRALIEGLRRYAGMVKDKCPDSLLYRNPYEEIFSFSCLHLAEDGCEPFEL